MRTNRDDIPFLVAELRRHILIVASTMKDNAFKDEREVRYITTNWSPLESVVHYEHARKALSRSYTYEPPQITRTNPCPFVAYVAAP